jgi:WD40 repeat protein
LDVKTGENIATFPGRGVMVSSVAFSPCGRLLAVGRLNNSLHLWDLTTGKIAERVRGGLDPTVAFSADGKLLASGYGGSDVGSGVMLWDVVMPGEATE